MHDFEGHNLIKILFQVSVNIEEDSDLVSKVDNHVILFYKADKINRNPLVPC